MRLCFTELEKKVFLSLSQKDILNPLPGPIALDVTNMIKMWLAGDLKGFNLSSQRGEL